MSVLRRTCVLGTFLPRNRGLRLPSALRVQGEGPEECTYTDARCSWPCVCQQTTRAARALCLAHCVCNPVFVALCLWPCVRPDNKSSRGPVFGALWCVVLYYILCSFVCLHPSPSPTKEPQAEELPVLTDLEGRVPEGREGHAIGAD